MNSPSLCDPWFKMVHTSQVLPLMTVQRKLISRPDIHWVSFIFWVHGGLPFVFFGKVPCKVCLETLPCALAHCQPEMRVLLSHHRCAQQGGFWKRKGGCQEGDEQPREVVCVIEGNISKKWLAYCARGCLLFFPLLPPGSDALLCKSNSDRHRERTGSAQSCEQIPDHQPAVWSPPGYRCCCWCSLRARL